MPLNLLVAKEIAWLGTHRFHAEFVEAVALIRAGALPIDAMISHSFPAFVRGAGPRT